MALDLNRDLEAALDGPVDLVTTSALLDLVSETWLERLAVETRRPSIPFYAALSYDGRIELTPDDPDDAAIIAAVNAHQRTDKGFGPALGPLRQAFAVTRFQSLGYALVHGRVRLAFGPNDRDMQSQVLSGWASAAVDTGRLTVGRCRRLAGAPPRRGRRRRFRRFASVTSIFLPQPIAHALSREVAVEQDFVARSDVRGSALAMHDRHARSQAG